MDPDLEAYLEKAYEKAYADLEKAFSAGDFRASVKASSDLRKLEKAIKAAAQNIDLGKLEKSKAAAQNHKKFNELYLTLRGISPFFKDVWKRKWGKVAIIGVGVCAVLLIVNSNKPVQDGIVSKATPEQAKDLIRPIDHPHYPPSRKKEREFNDCKATCDLGKVDGSLKCIPRDSVASESECLVTSSVFGGSKKCEDTEDPAECRLMFFKFDLDHTTWVNWLDYCQGKIGEGGSVCYRIKNDWLLKQYYPKDTTLKEMLKDLYDII
ncbi:MAG: hypothetical protein OXC96_04230 [Cyanobacteria bacterium MAG CAR1_bin_15]|nr:hypothetical protein [Cyanobacteria bacterium MAG CAR1_bin_15]